MKYFTNVENLEELRKAYKVLLKKFHPDNTETGSEEITKEIIAEYEKMFEYLQNNATSEADRKKYDVNMDEALRAALNNIINLNVNIEICGSWIWITGNTYPCKDTLKAAGFKWCSNKKAWSWHFGTYVSYGKKKNSMEYIRNKYGSNVIRKESDNDKLK